MSDPPPRRDEPLLERVQAQKQRNDRARLTSSRSLWRTVAHVGVLGWLIALPTVGGIYLGHQLDLRLGTGVTWALCCLALGLAGGGYLLWRTFNQVSEEESP